MSETLVKIKNVIFKYYFGLLYLLKKDRSIFYKLQIIKNKNSNSQKNLMCKINEIYERNKEHPLAYYEFANSFLSTDPLNTFKKLELFLKIQNSWETKHDIKQDRFLPLQQVLGSIGNYLTVYYYLLYHLNIERGGPKPTLLIKENEKINNKVIFNLFAPHIKIEKNSYKFFRDRDLIETFQIPLKIGMPFKSHCYPWFIGINYINQALEKSKKKVFDKLFLCNHQIKTAQEIGKKIGLAADDWFVTLHVREGTGNFYTNSNPHSYIPAIEHITSKGGKVVRVGDKKMTPLPKIKGLIDYPFSNFKSELMDVYLAQQSKFCIGTSSGYWTFLTYLGKPVLLTNYLPTLDYFILRETDMFLPKTIFKKGESNKSMIEKIFKYPEAYIDTDQQFENYEIIDNTDEEILHSVKDMMSRLDGNDDDEFKVLNQKFKSKTENLNNLESGKLKCFGNLSKNFLKQNL